MKIWFSNLPLFCVFSTISVLGTLAIDNKLPSLYNYRGVAQHNAQMTDESADSFFAAVTLNPNDIRSWINLGEARSHQFRLNEAVHAFTQALNLGDKQSTVSRLLRAKGWADSWRNFDSVSSMAEELAIACINTVRLQNCRKHRTRIIFYICLCLL